MVAADVVVYIGSGSDEDLVQVAEGLTGVRYTLVHAAVDIPLADTYVLDVAVPQGEQGQQFLAWYVEQLESGEPDGREPLEDGTTDWYEDFFWQGLLVRVITRDVG